MSFCCVFASFYGFGAMIYYINIDWFAKEIKASEEVNEEAEEHV